jgi:serine/threonine protein phosphatase 1
MRVLAVGDIHGCLVAFRALLAAVAPRPDDLIVTLGDYVDRGPDTRGVLDQLIELRGTGRLIALRGNHEVMMQNAHADEFHDSTAWLACGGRQTLASYGSADPTMQDLDRVPAAHWYFLEHDCRDWYETKTHLFVHASAYPDMPLEDQPTYMLHWEKLEDLGPHQSGKVLVCGHTRQPGGIPLDLGHAICLDTGAYAGGWLTCLDCGSGTFWQANEKGEVRTGRLEEVEETRFD